MLCSRPRHASMKKSLGFPTSDGTSHIWQNDISGKIKGMIFSWKNLGDKRLDVPGLGSVLVLEEVVRGAVAAQLHIQVKLLVKLSRWLIFHLMTRSKKQEASTWSSGRVSWRFKLFIPWLVKSRWISTLNPGNYLQTWQLYWRDEFH